MSRPSSGRRAKAAPASDGPGRRLFAAAGLAGYLAVGRRAALPEKRLAAHFVVDPPNGLKALSWGAPAVSPDGRLVAFAATSGSRTTLWVRSLESLVSRELPGTEDATLPFWSPDSQSLAFFASGELRRVNLAGGGVQRLCALPGGFTAGGDWTGDGTILFSAGGMTARLYTVAASGGEAKPLTSPDESRGEAAHLWPELLPDGRRFLFQVLAEGDGQGLYVASRRAPRETAPPADTHPRRRPGGPAPLRPGPDPARTAVRRGERDARGRAVDRRVLRGLVAGGGRLGVVLRLPRRSPGLRGDSGSYELVWFDRKGGRLGVVGDSGRYGQIALSPDERSVAVELGTFEQAWDIWTIDLARGVGTRQTSDAAMEVDPTWAPDGREIAFASNRSGAFRLYRKTLQGGQPETPFGKPLDEFLEMVFPESWEPDGQALVYHGSGKNGHRFGTLGRKEPRPRRSSRSDALDEPQVSPDGRWLAYISEESGRWEVYVEPFRHPGERVRVSARGGRAAPVARRREGALLRRSRRPADGGRGEGVVGQARGDPPGAPLWPGDPRPHPRHVRADSRRPAIPRRRPDRERHGAADPRRDELDVAAEVTRARVAWRP